jgi:integrase
MKEKKSRATFTDRSAQCAKVGRTQVTGTTGLYLVVGESGSRRFIFRYVSPLTKRPNECKVGPYPAISLKEACEQARAFQSLVAKGEDPVAFRRQEERRKQIDATTFGSAVDRYADALKARAGTANVVFVVRYHARALLDLPIAAVTVADVRKALAPTQASHPNTARRALGAVATIFDYAKASDMRTGDNPASWDVFRFLWPPPPAARHVASMPPRDVPALYRRLIEKDTTTALGLAFLILTAARTAEAVGGRWSEIDFDARLWVIPGERMKARREHRVCLSDAAMAILDVMRERHPNSDYLFPAAHGGRLGYRTLD